MLITLGQPWQGVGTGTGFRRFLHKSYLGLDLDFPFLLLLLLPYHLKPQLRGLERPWLLLQLANLKAIQLSTSHLSLFQDLLTGGSFASIFVRFPLISWPLASLLPTTFIPHLQS